MGHHPDMTNLKGMGWSPGKRTELLDEAPINPMAGALIREV